MELDAKLCYCFRISKRKIVNFVKREQPKRASQISECFGAGSGCGWCIPFLIAIHQEIVGEAIVEGEDISSEDYEALRLEYQKGVGCGQRKAHRYSATIDPSEEGHGDRPEPFLDEDF